MKIMRMGVDLAKNVFQLHGVDEEEQVVLRKQFKREKMLRFFAQLPPMHDRHGVLRRQPLLGERTEEAGA